MKNQPKTKSVKPRLLSKLTKIFKTSNQPYTWINDRIRITINENSFLIYTYTTSTLTQYVDVIVFPKSNKSAFNLSISFPANSEEILLQKLNQYSFIIPIQHIYETYTKRKIIQSQRDKNNTESLNKYGCSPSLPQNKRPQQIGTKKAN